MSFGNNTKVNFTFFLFSRKRDQLVTKRRVRALSMQIIMTSAVGNGVGDRMDTRLRLASCIAIVWMFEKEITSCLDYEERIRAASNKFST